MRLSLKIVLFCVLGILAIHLSRHFGCNISYFSKNGPNFFSSLGCVATIEVLQICRRKKLGFIALTVFGAHAAYEMLQLVLPYPATFDIVDLIASALGSIFAWLFFHFQKKSTN